jgi:hypothetical protein
MADINPTAHPTNVKTLADAHKALDRLATALLQSGENGSVIVKFSACNGFATSIERELREHERVRAQ